VQPSLAVALNDAGETAAPSFTVTEKDSDIIPPVNKTINLD
jgi:hypothetical protein